MIQFNLKEEKYKNHPDDGKLGIVTTGGIYSGGAIYSGYPLTIVDNKTDERSIQTLLHMSPSVRRYLRLNLYDDMLYLPGGSKDTYRKFNYDKVEVSQAEALEVLREVFYKLEPNLQSRSLVGTTLKGIENDPNYYSGSYVLNDEETYTILKCGDTVKFFKGEKSYYPDFKKEEDLIGVETIDFDLYALSLEYAECKRKLLGFTNRLLDEDRLVETAVRLKELEKELDKSL